MNMHIVKAFTHECERQSKLIADGKANPKKGSPLASDVEQCATLLAAIQAAQALMLELGCAPGP